MIPAAEVRMAEPGPDLLFERMGPTTYWIAKTAAGKRFLGADEIRIDPSIQAETRSLAEAAGLRVEEYDPLEEAVKILDPGHQYLLDVLDHSGDPKQVLTFVKREGEKFPFNSGISPGTNVQEVLRALIDRTDFLNGQAPCAETEAAAGCLRAALVLFEQRAARRHRRFLDLPSTQHYVCGRTCATCGHIGCEDSHG